MALDDQDQLGPDFRAVGDFLERGDFSPVLEQGLDEAALNIAENFGEAADAAGKPWPPRKRAYPHPPLIKTGRLLSSIAGRATGLVAAVSGAEGDHHWDVGEREASLGTSVEYAKAHEFGVPARNLPARPFANISSETCDMIAAHAADFAIEEIGKIIGETP